MKKGYAIGYDLNDRYSQISFFDVGEDEPKTIEQAALNGQIPLALAFFNGRWVYGKEAKRLDTINAGASFTDFFNKARHREKITVNDKSYDAVWLLAKFVQMTLADFEAIEYLTFTVPHTDVDMSNLLKGVAMHMSIPKERVSVQDYKESFCHYMYDQPKELWQYEAALFHCEDEKIQAYMLRKLNARRRDEGLFVTVDEVAGATVSELSAIFPIFDENKAADADEKFKVFIQGVFEKKVVSSVFLTGEGFEQEWYPKSLKVLCNGRRAFLGNNLYSKGACYFSNKVANEDKPNPIYLDETRLTKRVCLPLRVYGQETWYPVVPFGLHWYEADSQWEVLLEDVKELTVRIESLLDNKIQEEVITLEGIPRRGNYSLRMMIEIMFLDEGTCKIIIRDIGFGEFYKSTGFYIEKQLDLGGIHGQFNSMS